VDVDHDRSYEEVSPVSILVINENRTPGYLLPAGTAMSAQLLVDARPQMNCGIAFGAGWDQTAGISRQSAKFEQHVRPVVAEGTTGIPPSAPRDALD